MQFVCASRVVFIEPTRADYLNKVALGLVTTVLVVVVVEEKNL